MRAKQKSAAKNNDKDVDYFTHVYNVKQASNSVIDDIDLVTD